MNIVKKAHQWFIFIGKQYLLMLNLFTPTFIFYNLWKHKIACRISSVKETKHTSY